RGDGDAGPSAAAVQRGERLGRGDLPMTLRNALVVLVCVAASIIESTVPFLFHLKAARADLLLSVVLYLALHDEVVQGAALSLAAGYLADLTSATPPCLYTVLAVFTFVVVRLAARSITTTGAVH